MLGKSVLVVDDDEATIDLMQRFMTMLGFTVITAYDGEDALDIMRQDCTKFDAVLFDIAMPRLNGLKMAQAIREDLGCADLPLIALSARIGPGFDAEITSIGITGVIAKPFKPTSLRQLLTDLGLL